MNFYRNKTPNRLDCLASLSNDKIITPSPLAYIMNNILPYNFWSNPEHKILNISTKSGNILKHSFDRFFHGLQDYEPDKNKRTKHIIDNMLYGIALDKITAYTSRKTLYGDKDIIGNIFYQPCSHVWDDNKGKCIICDAPCNNSNNISFPFLYMSLKEISDMKFDAIIANPPYQINTGSDSINAPAIYHLFIEKAIKISKKVIMITPTKLYNGGMGKGLQNFRKKMLNDPKISKIIDYPDSKKVFEEVSISGGVSIFFRDEEHNGVGCEIIPEGDTSRAVVRPLNQFSVFVRDNKSVPIIEKIKKANTTNKYLDKKINARNIFDIETHDFKNISVSPKNIEGIEEICIYHQKRNNTNKGWIDKDKVAQKNQDRHNKIYDWKVLTKLVGSVKADQQNTRSVTSIPFIVGPLSCCSATYLVAGTFSTEEEAKRYCAYLKTKFVRFLIAQSAITHLISRERYLFVPDLPMDRQWTDAELYDWAGFTEKEINHIESQIKEMP